MVICKAPDAGSVRVCVVHVTGVIYTWLASMSGLYITPPHTTLTFKYVACCHLQASRITFQTVAQHQRYTTADARRLLTALSDSAKFTPGYDVIFHCSESRWRPVTWRWIKPIACGRGSRAGLLFNDLDQVGSRVPFKHGQFLIKTHLVCGQTRE